MTEIKLTTGQLNELARLAAKSATPLPRTSNRTKALERLQKLLEEKFKDNGAWYNSLAQLDPQDEEAFEAARLDLAEETGQDRPVPLPKRDEGEDQQAAEGNGSSKRGAAPSKAPRTRAEGAGRKSKYQGMLLYPSRHNPDGTPINPRRPGSFGHRSLGIICEDPGITYEEFQARGGRLRDLDWDIRFENATATDATKQDVS